MLADGLRTGLPHPGDDQTPERLIPMPGFRNTGMSDEQAEEFIGATATLIAEAAVHLLETRFELMEKGDALQLRQDAADAPDGRRVIHIHPDAQHEPAALSITIGKGDHVVIPRRALAALGEA
ncbi:hypothetical protein H7J75_07030 [Mycolicibacterium canariasense]|nr:hypothetical protein [Mycolicibacterium canariasense]ORV13603.1 hypothetical protein AWB94_05050 [Mycolicibacterium canariasense]